MGYAYSIYIRKVMFAYITLYIMERINYLFKGGITNGNY